MRVPKIIKFIWAGGSKPLPEASDKIIQGVANRESGLSDHHLGIGTIAK